MDSGKKKSGPEVGAQTRDAAAVKREDALAALRASEERYRLIVESARDYAIFTANIHGTIDTWPPGAVSVFGYTPEEVIGKPIDILYVPMDAQCGEPLRELTTAEQQDVARDTRWHLRKDGTRVFIEGFTRALRGSGGEVTGFLKIGQDVTARREVENRLRESEERFRLFVSNVQEYALVQTDRAGRITAWNAGAERLFGYDISEIVGRSFSQLMTIEDRAASVIENELANAVHGERSEDARWIVRKDGSRFWARWVTEPIRRDSGELRAVARLIRDETDRMRVEQALRASERQFNAVANFIPDLLWQSEVDGATHWYNARWYEYTGQTFEEAVGFGWTEAIHPDDREQSRAEWLKAIHDDRNSFRREHRIRRADGQYRWFLVQAEPLRDNGNVVRWFGAATDIHEQRVALDALRIGEASMRTMLASLSDAVIATDAEARVQYMNSVAEKLTGWAQHEAVGKLIEDVYTLTTLQQTGVVECQLRRALDRGEHIPRRRFMLHSRRGGEIPVGDTASPIIDGTRILGAVTIFNDITEELHFEAQQAEERDRLERKMHATSEALGYTRAELQMLSGHLMLAQDEERRRVAGELHDDLGQRTALLEFAVDRLRESAHVSGIPVESIEALRSQVRDLAQGLRDASHRLHPSALENLGLPAALRALVDDHCRMGQDLSFVDHGTPSDLAIELKTALYRIVQEALRNVAKYAPEAPARVSIRCKASHIHLIIEDAGPGFNKLALRGDQGLGLLSMQERARAVGGVMTLESTAGEGTIISVCVPMNREK